MARRLIAALGLGLAACGYDSCFGGPTLISTPRGRRRIRDLGVGEEVWSFDPVERRFAVGTVGAIHRARGEVRSVRTSRGVIGAVTASHPLFIASRELFAADIKVGETLLAWADDPTTQPVPAAVLAFARVAPGDTIEVFNLTVEGAFSTYFADGFFVHNKESPVTCDEVTDKFSISVARTPLCVGEATSIRIGGIAGSLGCFEAPADTQIVFATSDPAVLVTEGSRAFARTPGNATVTLLVDGRKRAETAVTVTACTTDAGNDADAASDAATGAATDADASD